MPQIGGYKTGYNFKLSATPTTPLLLTAASSSSSTAHAQDANRIITTNVSALYGTQYLVSLDTLSNVLFGSNPIVTITSSNTAVADISGPFVNYITNGSYSIIGSAAATSFYPSKTESLHLVNSTTGGTSTVVTTYTPDPINIANNVLVVYNDNSTNSTTVKNYYINNRPGMASANVLGISSSTAESVTLADFISTIRTPIADWIAANPSKLIRYIVLMPDIPSRMTTPNLDWTGNPSIQYLLYLALSNLGVRSGLQYCYNNVFFTPNTVNGRFSIYQYPGTTALITSINMGSVADCQAYIDKISTVANTKLVGTIIGTPGSYGNDPSVTINAVFDGNFATFFDAPNSAAAWVGMDFGTKIHINRIKYAPRGGQEFRMIGCKFQGANQVDFSDAVDLYTIASAPPSNLLTTVDLTVTGYFRYYRYYALENQYGNISELEFYSQLEPVGHLCGKTASGGYYIDEYQSAYSASFYLSEPAGIREENLIVPITIANGSHLSSCANVRGYLCWGANGGMGGDYAQNGNVVFTGSSNWYLIKTVESFNGQRSVFQGNFIDWFSTNAFGGSSYSNTPVGSVTHVDEPYLSGINNQWYWQLWERGYNLAECAWFSRKTDKLQVVGDPLVRR